VSPGKQSGYTDTAHVDYRFTSEGVEIENLTFESSVVAARAKGIVYYDGVLDLTANAGPMEKLQQKLGKVGEIFGSITDNLVKYHVTGRIGSPNVGVKPLGMGAGRKDRQPSTGGSATAVAPSDEPE
ncbi:MAG: hypothetical protein VYC34_10610, partial [Planctomycetota bacterium]|nr:hypothetical protein [Planctomycetota bacterium]